MSENNGTTVDATQNAPAENNDKNEPVLSVQPESVVVSQENGKKDPVLGDLTLAAKDAEGEKNPPAIDAGRSVKPEETAVVSEKAVEVVAPENNQEPSPSRERKTTNFTLDNALLKKNTDFLKYSIFLKNLEKNQEDLQKFLKEIYAQKDGVDIQLADVEKGDIELIKRRMDVAARLKLTSLKETEKFIKSFDVKSIFEKANISFPHTDLPPSVLRSIRVAKAFDEAFPNPSLPDFSLRLKSMEGSFIAGMKDKAIKLYKNDTFQASFSTALMGIAVGITMPAALPVMGAAYSLKMIGNPAVQKLFSSVEGKVNSFLEKAGLKTEQQGERKASIGEKMKSFADTKTFKAATLTLGGVLLLSGVGYGAAAMTEAFAPETYANFKQSIGDFFGVASEIEPNQLVADLKDSIDTDIEMGIAKSIGFDLSPNLQADVEIPYAPSLEAEAVLATNSMINEAVEAVDKAVSDIAGNSPLDREAVAIDKIMEIASNVNLDYETAEQLANVVGTSLEEVIDADGSIFSEEGSQFAFEPLSNVVDTVKTSIGFDPSNPFAVIGDSLSKITDGFGNTPELSNEAIPKDLSESIQSIQQELSTNFSQIETSQDPLMSSVAYFESLNEKQEIALNDVLSEKINNPSTDYVSKSGDNLWNLAEAHYEAMTGEKPDPKVIVAMVNDLGLKNPNDIGIGEKYTFTNDMSKYDNLGKVTADWLGSGSDTPVQTASAQDVVKALSTNPDVLINANTGEAYTPEQIAAGVAHLEINEGYNVVSIYHQAMGVDQLSIEQTKALEVDLQLANPNVDFTQLRAGQEIVIDPSSGVIFTVPEIEDVIIQKAFEGDVPQYLDKDKYVDAIAELNGIDIENSTIDLSPQSSTSASESSLILNGAPAIVPTVDKVALLPQSGSFEVAGRGVHGSSGLKHNVLEAIYANAGGVPDLLDKNAVYNDVVQQNRDLLKFVKHGELVQGVIHIENTNTPSVVSQSAIAATPIGIENALPVSASSKDDIMKGIINKNKVVDYDLTM